MALFRNIFTHDISKTYYLVNQVVTATVEQEFKECTCKKYPDNSQICPHCIFKENRLNKITVSSKLMFISVWGHYNVVSKLSYEEELHHGNFCDVCGRSDTELSTYCDLRICPTCRQAGTRG